MAKSKTPAPGKTAALPFPAQPGVTPNVIPELSKAVTKYETAKNKRCQASPGEIAAKQALQAALHKHRDKLPKNAEGFHFYRDDERDYVLEETMKIRRGGGEAEKD